MKLGTIHVLAERETGRRVLAGTDWPVRDKLVRDQRPGRRPTWEIVRGLCNGIAQRADVYRTRREALAAWEREGSKP